MDTAAQSYNLSGRETLTYWMMVERVFAALDRRPGFVSLPLSPCSVPTPKVPWVQNPKSGILRVKPACCTSKLNPRPLRSRVQAATVKQNAISKAFKRTLTSGICLYGLYL
jgi:uncharacterized protein YbjT (DUF2867 family)